MAVNITQIKILALVLKWAYTSPTFVYFSILFRNSGYVPTGRSIQSDKTEYTIKQVRLT